MSDIYKELKAKLAIDEHKLEIANRDNPGLVEAVGVEYVYAISERDLAKQVLDELEAGIDSDLRKEASLLTEKVTEKQIESSKKIHPKVIEATRNYLDLKLSAALWSTLKDSFDARTRAISNLIELCKLNYYSNIEKRGPDEALKTVQADKVKRHLAEARRVRV